jgi:MFS family permease
MVDNDKDNGEGGASRIDSGDSYFPSSNPKAGLVDIGATLTPTVPPTTPGGTRIVALTEKDCVAKLGFAFSKKKKWWIISVIFLIQTSMNFNASVYGNAVHPLMVRYDISQKLAVVGQAVFLIAYAFGCELWAPWSEERGRRWVLQMSLLFVNIWQIPCALAPNFAVVAVFRALGGLSSAGGSVTLGMVADMWGPGDQQYAVAFVVLSSVGGSIFGPVLGGLIEKYLNLQWNFWIQLIFGAAVQAIHYLTVPETRASCIVTGEARKRRKAGERHIFSSSEIEKRGMTWKGIASIWVRPFHMLAFEPVVLFLSLLSGFSDALIFTFLDSFGKIYSQWGFDSVGNGLAFLPIGMGYIIAYGIWLTFITYDTKIRKIDPDTLKPEHRLKWLMWTAPCLIIGIFIFAWTSTGPPMPWIVPMLASVLIGVANYAIYGSTIDYVVAAYGGKYAACATGGNGFARDFLAGLAAFYAAPLYTNIGPPHKALPYASTVLGCLAFVLILPIWLFYYKGQYIRERSPYAEKVTKERERVEGGGGAA